MAERPAYRKRITDGSFLLTTYGLLNINYSAEAGSLESKSNLESKNYKTNKNFNLNLAVLKKRGTFANCQIEVESLDAIFTQIESYSAAS